MSAEGPQLVPGTVQAVRAWDLIPEAGSGRVLLGAIAQRLVWPQGVLTAECVGGGHIGEGPPPGPGCDCGIYAWHGHELDRGFVTEYAEIGQIAGVIDAWGRIEVHEAGVRVQHARVAALLAESTAPREHLDIAGRAAATYGVELMCLSPPRFDAYLASEVRGLDKPFIERLLMSDRRLCFEPRSVSYISRRGEAVAGFGFVEPDGEHPKRFQKLLRTGSLATQILRVAGAKYHDEALQRDEFTPGRELALVPEPDNPRDPAAISVWDAARSRKVGYVPRELAPEVGARLAAGRIRTVRSVWQWRDLRSGRRTGLHMLVTPTSDVTFVGGEQLEVDAAA